MKFFREKKDDVTQKLRSVWRKEEYQRISESRIKTF